MFKSQLRAGLASVLVFSTLTVGVSNATVVEFQTSLGNFQVNLYDNGTPDTVANFMAYVNNGNYTDAIFHRSDPGFVIQGGGFAYDPTEQVVQIPANAAVGNEPEYSNVLGTISMAKIGGQPNSATNQWFFNLDDNSAILDDNNGGYSVFGEVTGDGMDVIDAIAALPRFAFDSPFSEMPLRNYTSTDFTDGVAPDDTHFVIITAIVLINSDADSAAGLNPTPNTLVGSSNDPGLGGGSGGGGAVNWLVLLSLIVAAYRRRTVRAS
jgi:peptidyl-prolyl cis-trans isomerase A (cyclophilin A)